MLILKDNKLFSPILEEKNGCLKLKELDIDSRSTRQDLTEKNGEVIWTRPRNSMIQLSKVYQRSEVNSRDSLMTSLKHSKKLLKKKPFSHEASKA